MNNSDTNQAEQLRENAVMQSVILPNELRFGNLLMELTSDDVFKVSKSFFILLEVNLECSRPIPLTEEWIVKFGFNCINRPKMAFKLYHNNENADFSSLILKEVGNNPIWVYAGNNRWTINPFTVEIKYVHQLQNLYFSLTGRELTVA